MKYKMLRDTPHGKAGSVWASYWESEVQENPMRISLKHEKYGIYQFPRTTLSDYFEEIKEMKPFTRDQAKAIKERLAGDEFKKDFVLCVMERVGEESQSIGG